MLDSCTQHSGTGKHATWETSKRPSSKPMHCCCQRSAWKLTAEYPPAATHILCVCPEVAAGHMLQCRRQASSDTMVILPAVSRKGCLLSHVSLPHIHTYTHVHTYIHIYEPSIFLRALLYSKCGISGLQKHMSLCYTQNFTVFAVTLTYISCLWEIY